jgi:biopolymer transport protein ExbD
MDISTEHRKKNSSIINITSLIDVVLLLLIFFMLTTSFVEQPGIKLDLPSSKSGDGNDPNENTITVSAEGIITLNSEQLDLSQLQQKLATLIDTSKAENTITIKADRSIDHGTVVNIMDATRLAGFQKLVIATEKGK